MEVLACIPELPCLTGSVATTVSEPPEPPGPAAVPCTRGSTPEPAVIADATDAEESDGEESLSPAPRRGAARRSRPSRIFSPSIIALTVVATIVWAAAWRNDRLRLEASRQQRPERLAQELPATAGAARSITP